VCSSPLNTDRDGNSFTRIHLSPRTRQIPDVAIWQSTVVSSGSAVGTLHSPVHGDEVSARTVFETSTVQAPNEALGDAVCRDDQTLESSRPVVKSRNSVVPTNISPNC